MVSKNILLGLMSGTSCDGLTVAAVKLSPFSVSRDTLPDIIGGAAS